VDAGDKPIEYEAAKKKLGALKMSEIVDVIGAFTTLLKDDAVNPPTAVS